MLDWLNGANLEDRDRGATLMSPYSQSSWVYIAISCLAENVAQIPLRISKVPDSARRRLSRGAQAAFRKRVLGENIIESGAAVDLFNNPHPTMDRALFWANIVSWKALRGEFFVLPLDNDDMPVDLAMRSGKVTQMLTLEPAMFWHVVVGYRLEAWRYTGSPLMSPMPSEMLSPSEVIHHRSYNPYLYWRGLSPLLLAILAAKSDYAASQFMKGLMMNNADTGVIATTDQNLTPEQREQFMAALRERKRKAGTPDRPLFLSSGVKIEKPTISNVDMEFLQNRKFNREEIFAVFKVPPSMAGIDEASSARGGGGISSSGGGGQQQDRRVFIENTVTNLCRQIEAAFTPIVKRFDPSYELWFDVDSLPIMQEARRDRLDAAGKAFGMGVPLNDINQAYDLGFPDYDWGKKGYLPFNLQEAGEQPEQADPGDDPNDPDNAETDSFQRARVLLAKLSHPAPAPAPVAPHVCAAPNGYEQSIAGSERAKEGRLKKFFFEQRNRVLARLDKIKSLRAIVTKDIDDLWDKKVEDAELKKKLKPSLQTDLEFGGAQLYEEIGAGIDFSLPPSEAIAFLAKRDPILSEINATTWNSVKSSLMDGLAAGDSTDQLAQRVKDVYAMTDSRAHTIAMTETNIAVNSGRHIAMKQAGIKRKGWLTAHLETTRATHFANEAISNKENGIPIDDIWPNGCAYPGDPAGAAGEVINCHCVGFAMSADGKGARINNWKFLHWEEFIGRKGGRK